MKLVEGSRLGKPKRIRLEEDQEFATRDIARRNHQIKLCKLVRIFVDMGVRLTDMNGGILPGIEQCRLQRALLRRAKRDARRGR